MRAFILAAIAACATIATPATQTPSTTTVYVSDLTETHASIGWGRLGKDVSVSATPLRLNGVTFAKGLGTHAMSDVRYDLAGLCTRFDAVIGVDDAVTAGSVRFQVLADGVLLYDTSPVVGRPMTGADPGLRVSVDVSGRRALSLRVS